MSIDTATFQAMLDRMSGNLKSEIHSAVDDLKHDMNSKLDNINMSTKAIKDDVDDLKTKDKIRREDIDTNAENIKENNKTIEANENRIKSLEKKQFKHSAEYLKVKQLENDVKQLKEMASKTYADVTIDNNINHKNGNAIKEQSEDVNTDKSNMSNDKNSIKYAKKRIGLGPIRLIDVGFYAGGINFTDIHEANKDEYNIPRKEAIKEVLQNTFKILDDDLEISNTKFSNNADGDLIFFNTSESVIKRLFSRIQGVRHHNASIKLQTFFPQSMWMRKSYIEERAKEERAKNPRLRTSIRLGNQDLEVWVKEVGEVLYTKMPINNWGIPPAIGVRKPTTISPPKPRYADGQTWIGQDHNGRKRPQDFSPTTQNQSKTSKPSTSNSPTSFGASLAAELQSAGQMSPSASSASPPASSISASTTASPTVSKMSSSASSPSPPTSPPTSPSSKPTTPVETSVASSPSQYDCNGYASGMTGNPDNLSSGHSATNGLGFVKSIVSKKSYKISKSTKNNK